MKILIVDDHAAGRDMLSTYFRAFGHQVVEARSGIEAVAILSQGSGIEAVVSDILMPDMDGYQLCRHVRADPALQALPFVFYTATYTDPKDHEFGLSLGADAFLIKPLDPELVAQTVQRIVSREPTSRPVANVADEGTVLASYNARLIGKLEDKLSELDLRNREVQRLYDELERVQKAEILGRVATAIAHDFNNVLAVTLAHAERIERTAGTAHADASAISKSAASIVAASLRGRDLVRQISYASISPPDGDDQAVDFLAILHGALALVETTLSERIKFVKHVPDSLPMIKGSAGQLHQVIANLCTSAARVLATGGQITVSVKAGEQFLEVAIADTAAPLDAEMRSALFNPLSMHSAGHGRLGHQRLGLKLFVARRIVERHRGTFMFDSAPSGNTARFRLPTMGSFSRRGSSGTIPFGAGQRILIVDDNELSLQAPALTLGGLRYSVVQKLAPVKFSELPRDWDAALVSLDMLQQNGVEVLAALRLQGAKPLFGLTGMGFNVGQLESLQLSGILEKPWSERDLAHRFSVLG